MVAFLLIFAIAFLLGSLPSGVIIGKLLYGVDIREHGSGNIGTTNALRSLGKKAGAIVFLLDFSKGLIAGWCALAVLWLGVPGGGLDQGVFPPYSTALATAFLASIMGHIFSPWLGFKGGKGIAVAVGCLFVTFGPVGALIELAVFGIVVAATRYVSAGSIAAAALCPVLSAYYFLIAASPKDILAWVICTAGALLVLWAHRGNMQRLMQGTEHRFGEKSEGAPMN